MTAPHNHIHKLPNGGIAMILLQEDVEKVFNPAPQDQQQQERNEGFSVRLTQSAVMLPLQMLVSAYRRHEWESSREIYDPSHESSVFEAEWIHAEVEAGPIEGTEDREMTREVHINGLIHIIVDSPYLSTINQPAENIKGVCILKRWSRGSVPRFYNKIMAPYILHDKWVPWAVQFDVLNKTTDEMEGCFCRFEYLWDNMDGPAGHWILRKPSKVFPEQDSPSPGIFTIYDKWWKERVEGGAIRTVSVGCDGVNHAKFVQDVSSLPNGEVIHANHVRTELIGSCDGQCRGKRLWRKFIFP